MFPSILIRTVLKACAFSLGAVAAFAQSGTYTMLQGYMIPTDSAFPAGITAGPDGALWFTESGSYLAGTTNIGRITTSGVITTYPTLTPDSQPWFIINGPDGALWFTEYGANNIGRITTDGVVTEYPTPTPGSGPFGIATGPDGALWFTEHLANQIGRITTAGVFTEYPANVPDYGYPEYITAGPDGALWFTWYTYTGSGSGGAAEITTAGAVTLYQAPESYGPFGELDWITEGPDGNLWFADDAGNIWRMTPAGAFTQYPVPLRPSGGGTGPLAVGPDQALWFTVSCTPCSNGWIGRITTSGLITEFPEPSQGSLGGIAAGPDGTLWFTDTAFFERIHSAIVRAPACALGLSASYNGTKLKTNFDLGIATPADWSIVIQHTVGLEVPIGPAVPPRPFSIDWTIPAADSVLVKSELSDPGGKVICAEWTTVTP